MSGRRVSSRLRPRPQLLAAVTALALLAAPAAHSAAAEPERFDRLHLLGADTDYDYWSVDPDDPELPVGTIVRRCGLDGYGVPAWQSPCLTGRDNAASNEFSYSMFFFPGSLLDEPVAWGPDAPVRFRFTLDVEAPLPYTVHLAIQRDTDSFVSAPAEEVAPGVWEGELARQAGALTGEVNS